MCYLYYSRLTFLSQIWLSPPNITQLRTQKALLYSSNSPPELHVCVCTSKSACFWLCVCLLKMKSSTIFQKDKGKKIRRERETNRKKTNENLVVERETGRILHIGETSAEEQEAVLSAHWRWVKASLRFLYGQSSIDLCHLLVWMGSAIISNPISHLSGSWTKTYLQKTSFRLCFLEISQSQTWEPPT